VGFTVIVKVCCGPVQITVPFSKLGVTVIVAVTGEVPEFTALKEIFPLPVAPKPIEGVSLVQEYVAVPPLVIVVKFTVVGSVLQTT
jgi:hypothetical protein